MLLSASHTGQESRNLTLSVNGQNLHFEARTDTGAYLTNLDWPVPGDRAARLNDGQWHTAVVTVGAQGTKIYLDGYQVHSGTSDAFFGDLVGLNALRVGQNQDVNGLEWGFTGDIAATQVYNTVLTDAEVRALYPAPDTATKWTPDLTYSPTIALGNKLSSSSGYGSQSTGTMFAYFRTTATGVRTILSAANTTQASSNITIALNNGALYYEHRVNGTYSAQFTVPGHWNDGNWHSVALRVDERGTVLYADGAQVERHTSPAFMDDIPGLNGLWAGGNVDSAGEEWKFDGQIGRIKLFTWSLTESDIKNLANVTPLPTQALFDSGYAGAANYRIPSLLKTSAGTLLAGADQRTTNAYDSPNDINLVVRRSTDGGQSWNPASVLLDYPGTGANGASVIDSVLVQNASTGRIFAVVDRFPGGGGQANSQVGTGYDTAGRKILTAPSGTEYRLQANGAVVTTGGAATAFTVAANGDILNGTTPAGNIHTKPGVDPAQALYEYRTAYLVMIYSDDDGVTWSQPRDITTQVKADWMRFIGTGPGNGIQLQNGPHAGRLLVPIYYNNTGSPANVYSSAMIYSDDNGLTWHRTASPNDGRVYNGQTIDSQTLNFTAAATHEPTIVERPDGSVLMLMRNLTPGSKIVKSTTADAGATWSQPVQDAALPEIFSQPNAVKFTTSTGAPAILFGNATKRFPGQNGATTRGTGVIRMSLDGGATWAHSQTFRSDTYVYNNLVQLDANTIGLLWEMEWDGLYFTRIPTSWLTSSGW